MVYDPSQITIELVCSTVEDAGFEALPMLSQQEAPPHKARPLAIVTGCTVCMSIVLPSYSCLNVYHMCMHQLSMHWGATKQSDWCGICISGDDRQPARSMCNQTLSPQLLEIRQCRVQVATMRVTGMTCASCSNALEKALKAMGGVQSASVSLSLEQAEVSYDPSLVSEVRFWPVCILASTRIELAGAQGCRCMHSMPL